MLLPLARLTKKNEVYNRKEDQERAFCTLKESLVNEPILALFDPNSNITELHTDACLIGIASILLQSGSDCNSLKLVYCVSKRLGIAEKNYHSSKTELLAIVWSVERLRPFLLRTKFTIYPECQAFMYLNVHKPMNLQVAR